MTKYTMKKLFNCLSRDKKNHSDLTEAIREALYEKYGRGNFIIDNDFIKDTSYYFDYDYCSDEDEPEEFYRNDDGFVVFSNSDIAELLA